MDYKGALDRQHLRIKQPHETPLGTKLTWKPEYGTRLFGFWNKDGKPNPDLQLPDHDDMDCIKDLEKAGLIENIGTGMNPVCKLTEKGFKAHIQLARHKREGGQFAGFIYKE